MRILITGIAGQLGHDMMIELQNRKHNIIGMNGKNQVVPENRMVQLDFGEEEIVKATTRELCPDAIIHCAAWTAVDAAEDAENRDAVYSANVLATRYLAEACAAVGAKMLYLSTDYVFDGQGTQPWRPDDECYAPLNYYGQTKLEGELAVYPHWRSSSLFVPFGCSARMGRTLSKPC